MFHVDLELAEELGRHVFALESDSGPFTPRSFGATAPEHALASAAIPFLFPAVRVGDTYFCDGSLRQQTPLAPALRLGSNRVLVVGLRHGRPPSLTDPLAAERIEALINRTRNGGAEIVSLLKTGSAYYAPSSAAVQMAEAIAKDKNRILPCAVYLEGEYGQEGIFFGVPCKLGAGGLKAVFEVELTEAERTELAASANSVRATMAALEP